MNLREMVIEARVGTNVYDLERFRKQRGPVEGLVVQLRRRKLENHGRKFKTDRERVIANRL